MDKVNAGAKYGGRPISLFGSVEIFRYLAIIKKHACRGVITNSDAVRLAITEFGKLIEADLSAEALTEINRDQVHLSETQEQPGDIRQPAEMDELIRQHNAEQSSRDQVQHVYPPHEPGDLDVIPGDDGEFLSESGL